MPTTIATNNNTNNTNNNTSTFTDIFRRAFQWQLFRETMQEWSRDHASSLAASLAFYTATVLAQLLIGILVIAGFLYSTDQAQAQLVAQAQRFIGAQGGEIVQGIIENADQPDLLQLTGILALIVLLWSGSNIFVQLQTALNTVWGVQLRSDLPLSEKVKHRLMPVLLVAGLGLVVIAATLGSAVLSAVGQFVTDLLPGGAITWQIINYVITLVVMTGFFLVIFKVLPDVEIAWRDVWPGAALTAILFLIGQLVLGWYLGRQSSSSVYGAAGSLIVLLLWIYYSAQILLFGAEYVQVYASRYGDGIVPDDDAEPLGSNVSNKPAAQAVRDGKGRLDMQSNQWKGVDMEQSRHEATGKPGTLWSLGLLFGSLLEDVRHLVRQEIRLARVEIQDSVRKLVRGLALTVGGGMILYAGSLLVIVPIILVLYIIMPLWLATFLVGLLLLINGWLLTVYGRGKLREALQAPQRVVDSLTHEIDGSNTAAEGDDAPAPQRRLEASSQSTLERTPT